MGLISRVSSRTYRTSNSQTSTTMGRVRTKTVKKASRRIIEKYYTRLTMDYYTNSRIVDDIAVIPTKRLKNQIAGFITHTMKRIAKGPVRGISIKLQEDQRERRDNYVPDKSALDVEDINVVLQNDESTKNMLAALKINVAGLN